MGMEEQMDECKRRLEQLEGFCGKGDAKDKSLERI
jgi:hypothetical protein